MKRSSKLFSCVAALALVLMVQMCFASIIVRNDDRTTASRPSLHNLAKGRSVKLNGLSKYNWVYQSRVQSLRLQPLSGQQFQVNTTLQYTKGNTSYQMPRTFTLKVPKFRPLNNGSTQRF